MKPTVSNKRADIAVLILLPAVLLLVLPFYEPEGLPYVMLLLGRFHPVILHFPIVLIIVALILELLSRWKKLINAGYVITIILIAAAFSTLVAIASGFLLYASGDYSGPLLERHLWVGVITGTAILCTVSFFFLYRHYPNFYSVYFITLLVSNGAVAYTSHLGGALTHGEEYLTEYLPLINNDTEVQALKPESEMLVYEDMIVPVFEAKCVSCHNETRAKGEFSMTSLEKMIKGGESGNAGIVPGKPDTSELFKRIILPEDHDDRMPPKGKTPLTDAETNLIKFWIGNGAKSDLQVQQVRSNPEMNNALTEIFPALKRYRRKLQIEVLKRQELERALDTLAWRLNISIQKDSAEEEDLYKVAMKFPPAPFTNEQFRELAPYGNLFSRLSLVSSGIEDDGLYHISQMKNVKALFLQKTNLKGGGLVFLKDLQELEVLNLSYTKIDDKSVLELLKIPKLREVYLFQTKTSPEVLKALQENKPSLKILLEEGPYN